ncbi:S46 family peptidase, partial [candidate division KSB1 bacterium]|nr:S46 family peptidase [candidate division KSB1 bacterium]
LYNWLISLMKEMGENDREVALKHLSRIKGLSNVEKNYRGKLLGLKRLDLVEQKRLEEQELMEYIKSDESRNAAYRKVLPAIEKLYLDRRVTAERELNLHYMRRNSYLFRFAYTVYEAAIERQKSDIERESPYMDKNFSRTKNRLLMMTKDYYEPTDKIVFKEFLMRLSRLPEDQQVNAVQSIIDNKEPEAAINEFLENAYQKSKLRQQENLEQALQMSEAELKQLDDPFIKFTMEIYPAYKELREINKSRKGEIDELAAKLIDVKKDFLETDFIPDANGTLRFTYGHIRGYSPANAIYYHPITTLDGVIEKTTGEPPFNTPEKLIELYMQKDFGRFYNQKVGSVPTAILYDMDTTGGNSGSPVMNANGEIVGVNFDRAFEATINDYAWSEDYSRSIAVDIRYVLWVTQKYGGADYLLREMNVDE